MLDFNWSNPYRFSGLWRRECIIPTNLINSFFNYWEYIIKGKGIILYHKILRLVADKHEVSDNALMKKINKKMLNEITGDAYNIFKRYDEDLH